MRIAIVVVLTWGAMAVNAAGTSGTHASNWRWLILLFAVGMLLSIVQSIKLLKRSSQPGPEYWRKRFEQACNRHDPLAAEQALLYWGRLMLEEKSPETLEGLALQMNGKAARQQIRQLQDVCRSGDQTGWNAYLCAQVVGTELQQANQKQADD